LNEENLDDFEKQIFALYFERPLSFIRFSRIEEIANSFRDQFSMSFPVLYIREENEGKDIARETLKRETV